MLFVEEGFGSMCCRNSTKRRFCYNGVDTFCISLKVVKVHINPVMNVVDGVYRINQTVAIE